MTAPVELWFARFDKFGAVPQPWLACLDAGERARAARFAQAADADAFVARHALLRHVLGRRLRRPPARLEFVLGAHGKPALRHSDGSDRPLFFNLSSSGAFALLALGEDGEIGVDLERMLPTGLEAAALFAPTERAEIARRPHDEALLAFYRYWVCKEAVLKAAGHGLAVPLDALEISPPDCAPAVLSHGGRLEQAVHLRVVHPAPNLIAAVATFTPADVVIRTWVGLSDGDF